MSWTSIDDGFWDTAIRSVAGGDCGDPSGSLGAVASAFDGSTFVIEMFAAVAAGLC